MKKSKMLFAGAFVLLACEFAAFYLLGSDYAIPIFAVGFVLLGGIAMQMHRHHRCPACKIPLKAGNTFLLNIQFCPSCGAKLPS